MADTRTRLPLPEPDIVATVFDSVMRSYIVRAYSADQMHAYSDAENAALRAEVEAAEEQAAKNCDEVLRLREALRIVRLYPDFDEGGPLADMMDDVLSGKETPMLQLMDSLELQGLLAARKAAP